MKLVRTLGYPQEVFDFQYDSTAFRRGLIIDKKRGNILKVDRHKYVRKAFHGLSKEIPSKDRKALYSNKVTTFTESNYVNIDTLFHPIGTCKCKDIQNKAYFNMNYRLQMPCSSAIWWNSRTTIQAS